MYVRKKCTRPAGSCSIKTLWVFYSIICHTKHLFTELIQWMTIWQTNSRCSSKPLHSDDPISIINFYSRPNNQIPNTYRSIRVQIRASHIPALAHSRTRALALAFPRIRAFAFSRIHGSNTNNISRSHRPVPNSIKSSQSTETVLRHNPGCLAVN